MLVLLAAVGRARADEVDGHREAARAAVRELRLDDAEAHVTRGVRLDRGAADLLGLGARVHLMRGDTARASLFARRALEIDPAEPSAIRVAETLASHERAQAPRERPAPGSPEAFVDALIARAVEGATVDELAASLAPSDRALPAVLGDVLDTARRGAAQGARLVGWIVHPARRRGDGRHEVVVEVATAQAFDAGHAAEIARLDRLGLPLANGFLVEVLEGLAAEERAVVIARLPGVHAHHVDVAVVELVALDGGDYRIVALSAGDGVATADVPAAADPFVIQGSTLPPMAPSGASRAGHALGQWFAGAIASAVIAAALGAGFARRRRRRR